MRRKVRKKSFFDKFSYSNRNINIFLVVVFLLLLSGLTIGYSFLNNVLSIKGDVAIRPFKDIRITSVTGPEMTNGAYENYNFKYSHDLLVVNGVLPTDESSLTYTITITNNGNIDMDLIDIINTCNDGNIYYELGGIKLGDTIKAKTSVTITVTLKTKVGSNNSFNSQLQFIFEESYIDITAPVITFDPIAGNTCNTESYNVKIKATDDIEVTSLKYCQTTGKDSICTPNIEGDPKGTEIAINTNNDYHVICVEAKDSSKFGPNTTLKCSNEDGHYYKLNNNNIEMTSTITPSSNNGSNGWYNTLPIVKVNNTKVGCIPYQGYKYQLSVNNVYNSLSSMQTNDTALNNEIKNNECKTLKYKVTGYDQNDNNSVTIESAEFKYDKTAPVITVDGHNSNYNVEYNLQISKYESGTTVYYNPVDGVSCSVNDYKEANSLNQYKGQTGSSGCMKWYIISADDVSGKVNMILDHNTTYKVAWNSKKGQASKGPSEVLTQLQSDTSSWNSALTRTDSYRDPSGYTVNYSNYKARLIESNEVQMIINSATNKSDYAWIFDYTNNCTSNGCNINDGNTLGYWTSTLENKTSNAYLINSNGLLSSVAVNLTDYGVRPVITVNKSDLYKEFVIPSGTTNDNCNQSVNLTQTGNVLVDTEGSYPIKYTATDLAGNSNELTLMVDVVGKKDLTAPEVTFNPLPNDDFSKDDYVINVKATDNVGVTSLMYCQTTNASCTPNIIIANNSEANITISDSSATNTICVLASDGSIFGPNHGPNTVTVCNGGNGKYYKLDKIKPSINPTLEGTIGDNGWYKSNVTIIPNGSDSLSEYKGHKYQTSTDNGNNYNNLSGYITNNITVTNECVDNKVKIIGYDNVLNESDTYISDTIKIDKTSPVITVDGHTSDYSVDYGIGSGNYVIPTGTANDNCNGNITVTSVGSVNTKVPGSYPITYTATDQAGNTKALTLTVNVKDVTKPVITFNPIANDNWSSTDYIVNIKATDDIGVTSLKYCQTTNTSCTPTTVVANNSNADITISNSSDTNTICVLASDGNVANNVTVCNSASGKYYKLDKVAPTINPSLNGTIGNNNWYKSDVVINPNGMDTLSRYKGHKYQTSIDNGNNYNNLSDYVTNNITVTNECVDNKVKIIGYDNVLNNSDTYTSDTIKIDKTSPVITVEGHTSDYSVNHDIALNSEYIIPTGSATDNCNGNVNVTTSGTVNWTEVGSYPIIYTATDQAGNTTTLTLIVNVVGQKDTTAPVITFNPIANDDWSKTDYKVKVSATDDVAVTSFMYCQTTSTSCTPTNIITNNSSIDLTINTSSETNTICAKASDNSKYGPNSVTVCNSNSGKYYKLDKIAPTINPSLSGTIGNNGWYKSDVTIIPNGSDALSQYKGHKYQTSTNNGTSYNTLSDYVTNNITVTNECVDNRVRITGYDNALNNSSTYTSGTIKIDKIAPVITVDGHTTDYSVDYNVGSGNYVIPTGSATDNCNGNATVTTSGSVNTKVPGSYPIIYTATDQAGNSKTLTLTVNVKDVNKPVITFNPMPNDSWSKDDYIVNIGATDDVSITSLKYCQTTSASCTPTIISTNNNSIDLTINTSSATNTICASASDNANNITTTCSTQNNKYYKLDKVVPTINPSLSGTTGTNGWYKSNVTINVNGSDALSKYMGHKYQTSTNNGASYNTLSDYVTTNITVTNECVDNRVRITGYDNALNNSSTYTSNTIKIDKTVPVITVDGHTSDYSVNHDVALNSEYVIPAGSAIDNCNGNITVTRTGTVKYTEVGSYPIVYMATDQAGNSKTLTLTVNVIGQKDTTAPEITFNPVANDGWSKDNYSVKVSAIDDVAVTSFMYCQTTSSSCTPNILVTNNSSVDVTISTSSATNTICALASDSSKYGPNSVTVCNSNNGKYYKLDKVVPTISPSLNGTLGTNGWYKSDVIINPNGTDALSKYKGHKYQTSTNNGTSYNTLSDYTTNNITLSNECVSNKVRIIGYDNALNNSSTYTSDTIKIDKTAPVITVDGHTSDYSVSHDVSVSGDYVIPNGSAIDNCNGNLTVTKTGTVDSSEEGSYLIKYTATDQAGNTKTLTLTVNLIGEKDITAPEITFNPEPNDDFSKDNYLVNVKATDDVAVTNFMYCQTTSTSCTPNIVVTNNSNVDVTISTSSKTNTICAKASDSSKYGPNSTTVCSNKDNKYYKLDKIAPTINPSLSGTIGSNGWYKSNVTINVNGSDTLSQYMGHKYQTSTNNGTSYNTLSDYTTSNITVTNECVDNKVRIIGYDNILNNSSTYTSNTIKIDKTIPVITVDGHTSDYSVDYNIGGADYVIPTGSANDNCNGNITVTRTGTVNSKTPGSYPIKYTATDLAGNSKTLTLTVIVKDITKPIITFNPVTNDDWSKTDYVVNVSSTDDVAVTSLMYCKTTSTSCTPNLVITNNSNTNVTISDSSATNTICVKATDNASNITTVCSNQNGKYYKLDKLAPTINPSLSETIGSNGWYKSNVTINVNGSDTLSQYMGHKYQTSTNNGVNYSTLSDYTKDNIIVNNECVDNKVKITGYDNALNNSSTYTSNTIKIDKTSPVITVDGHTTNYSVDYEISSPKYENGTLIYYNPVTGLVCDESEYVASNSLNENKTGCMKWYIFNDEEVKTNVDMILDHNTTYNKVWISAEDYTKANTDKTNCEYDACTDEGPITALAQLKADTASWNDSLIRNDSYTDSYQSYIIDYSGYKARLIDANEIAKITGADKVLKWNSGLPWGTTIGNQSSNFYFDGTGSTYAEWQTQVANRINKSNYAWLYDYTNDCIDYGCNIDDSAATAGYWTSSASFYNSAEMFSQYAWYVGHTGRLFGFTPIEPGEGIRPVITIPKSLLPSSYTLPTGTSNDNCNGNITVTTTGSVNTKVPGNYPVTYTATDLAGNSKTLTLTVNVKDTKAPTINSVDLIPSACTNGDVTAKVNATDNYKLGTSPYSFDNGAYQSSSSKSYSANGEYNVKVKDSFDNVTTNKSFTIENIDKIVPSVSYSTDKTLTNNISNEPFTLSFNIIDSGCGNSSLSYLYCISTNGSDCTPNIAGTGTTHEEYFDQNGQYKICTIATDGVGNSSGIVCSENYTASFEIWEKYDSKTMYLWERWNTNKSYVQGSEYGSAANTTNYAVSTSSTAYAAGSGSCEASDIYYGSRSSSTFGYWSRYTCKANYAMQWDQETNYIICAWNQGSKTTYSCGCDTNGNVVQLGSKSTTLPDITDGSTWKPDTSYYFWTCVTGSNGYGEQLSSLWESNSNSTTQCGGSVYRLNHAYRGYCRVSNYTKTLAQSNVLDTYSAHTNASSCTSTSDIYTRSAAYSWKKYHCNAQYSKGTVQQSDTRSDSSTEFPTNGKNGDYWYVKKADTTYEKGDTLIEDKIYAASGTYPDNGRYSDGYWYVKQPVKIDYDYTGSYQIFTAPTTGKYKLETWGAQGGYRTNQTYGGKGGYSTGEVSLLKGEQLLVYVGGQGNNGTCTNNVCTGGYNGGGLRHTYKGGGGASDMRKAKKYRYVRDYAFKNSVNDGAHWVEIEVYDIDGNLISANKSVTANFELDPTYGQVDSLQALVDGVKTSNPYISVSSVSSMTTSPIVEIDLGKEYYIGKVIVWHYFKDGRTYYNTKTVLWNSNYSDNLVIFDSAISGTYAETEAGHTIDVGANSRFIVAGGGGSDGRDAVAGTGGYGGGTSGGATSATSGAYGTGGYAGTQTGVSNSAYQTLNQSKGVTVAADTYAGFGFGGNGTSVTGGYGGAGGSGWYGGAGINPDSSGDDERGGAGGSGFVWTTGNSGNVPNTYLVSTNYYLENASTIEGNKPFTAPDGSSETGHVGNGYARITLLEEIDNLLLSPGTIIYYNPVDNVICNENDYKESNSLNEYKGQTGSAGCMKWYVINDDDGELDIILDHNTTMYKEWNNRGNNSYGPLELLSQLKSDTDNWNNNLIRTDDYNDQLKGYTIEYKGYKARLIEANEVARITGNSNWNNASEKYGFVIYSSANPKYSWLHGGQTYWTSSASIYAANTAWYVDSNFNSNMGINYNDFSGVRPVITIPKSILTGESILKYNVTGVCSNSTDCDGISNTISAPGKEASLILYATKKRPAGEANCTFTNADNGSNVTIPYTESCEFVYEAMAQAYDAECSVKFTMPNYNVKATCSVIDTSNMMAVTGVCSDSWCSTVESTKALAGSSVTVKTSSALDGVFRDCTFKNTNTNASVTIPYTKSCKTSNIQQGMDIVTRDDCDITFTMPSYPVTLTCNYY